MTKLGGPKCGPFKRSKSSSSLQFVVVTCMMLIASCSYGQRVKNYQLQIADEPFTIEGDALTNWNNIRTNVNTHNDGDAYVIVQFNNIPSLLKKAEMSSEGVQLLAYIPNYAWVASIDLDISQSSFAKYGVRNFQVIESKWKVSSELYKGIVPSHAGRKESIKANVTFWKAAAVGDCENAIQAITSNWTKVELSPNVYEFEASHADLLSLANNPLIQYIDFISPPIINEFYGEAEVVRSTYISDNPGMNYFFDGTGVNICIGESGWVDSADNPDYRSRLDRTYESNSSLNGHKTGSMHRMGNAGNIDPDSRGTAFGAKIYSNGWFNIQTASVAEDVTIISHAYGWGCSSSATTYSNDASNHDAAIRNNPESIITYSAGNSGPSTCYANTAGYGNISGLPKMAKNIFVVGGTNLQGEHVNGSSRGPAKDGRVLPHVLAPGMSGTSFATPLLAGVFGQLNQAYRFHNNGVTPNASLLKAIIMNTSDDIENPGPDFITGYGVLNARRAYDVIRQDQFLTSSIDQSTTNTHNIAVPGNVKKLKVLVYWADYQATPGMVTKTLVNDIDAVLQSPSGTNYQPWVLNPAFDSLTLSDDAVRAYDTLNNVEQITINNPTAGNYQLAVEGFMIPQGPQEYYVTYEFVYDDIVVIHPHGGEHFVQQDLELIRWDAWDTTATFDLSYSIDNGASWQPIATVPGTDRTYHWLVPQAVTNQALVKVTSGSVDGVSDAGFHIMEQPTALELLWSCADSSMFIWDGIQDADGYIAYRIVGDYMDSVGYTTVPAIVLNGLSGTEPEYVSVAAVKNGAVSKRLIAIVRPPSNFNCGITADVAITGIGNPAFSNLPTCFATPDSINIRVRNYASIAVNNVPVNYQINGGTVYTETITQTIPAGLYVDFAVPTNSSLITGSNLIDAWTSLSNDSDLSNDDTSYVFNIYPSAAVPGIISESFDGFATCSSSWDCEQLACPLQGGWYNVPNGNGDQIDWITYSGNTPSGGAGPSGDHTSGSGNYLFLEASGSCSNREAKLYSPCLDFTGAGQILFSLWYHGRNNIGSLHVDVIADGVLYEDVANAIAGDQGNEWHRMEADLSAFAGQTVVVVIRGYTSNSWTGDLAIDDINIVVTPSASFTPSETNVCPTEIVTLNNTSGFANNYSWSIQPNTVTYENGTSNASVNPEVSFNAPGTYTVELIAINNFGQDTAIQVDQITVWEQTPSIQPLGSFCEGDSVIVFANNNGQPVEYYLNGTMQSSGTNDSYYYANAANGDQVYVAYILNSCTLTSASSTVDITQIDNAIQQSGNQLLSQQAGANYQWLDCDNGYAPISGEASQSFAPLADGLYAVEITLNGCVDTSQCLVYSTISISEEAFESFVYYPNPTADDVTLEFSAVQSYVEVQVYGITGQLVTSQVYEDCSKFAAQLPEIPGVYVLRVSASAGVQNLQIIKN